MITKCISVTSHALGPLPWSQTVTPTRTPSPSSVTYFMDGPQVKPTPLDLRSSSRPKPTYLGRLPGLPVFINPRLVSTQINFQQSHINQCTTICHLISVLLLSATIICLTLLNPTFL